MDRGTWWATVHGVAKSWTQLSTIERGWICSPSRLESTCFVQQLPAVRTSGGAAYKGLSTTPGPGKRWANARLSRSHSLLLAQTLQLSVL